MKGTTLPAKNTVKLESHRRKMHMETQKEMDPQSPRSRKRTQLELFLLQNSPYKD